jgi:DNA-binding IclR family transcriptional regulator
MSLPRTATGRVFCAYHAPEALRAMWSSQAAQPAYAGHLGAAGHPATDPASDAAFAATLDTIRTRGFELAVDTPSPGVSSVCVPVLDAARELRLTLTAIGASGTLDVRASGAVVQALREAANAIAAAALSSTANPTCPE